MLLKLQPSACNHREFVLVVSQIRANKYIGRYIPDVRDLVPIPYGAALVSVDCRIIRCKGRLVDPVRYYHVKHDTYLNWR